MIILKYGITKTNCLNLDYWLILIAPGRHERLITIIHSRTIQSWKKHRKEQAADQLTLKSLYHSFDTRKVCRQIHHGTAHGTTSCLCA